MNTLKVETKENYPIKNRATGGAQIEKQNNKINQMAHDAIVELLVAIMQGKDK